METRLTEPTKAECGASCYAELAERLKQWRRTRRRGQRIPEELWEAAAALAQVHGLNPTSAALRLNYYDLRKRLESPMKGQDKSRSRAPTFLEMPKVMCGQADPGTVEVVRANGSRMTLRLSAARSCDLLPLMKEFLKA